MLQGLATGENANSVVEQLHSFLLGYSGEVSYGFSPLVMQFANVNGGGQHDSGALSEPESRRKAVLARGGCGRLED